MSEEFIGIFVIPILSVALVLVIWLIDGRTYLYDLRDDDIGIGFYIFQRIRLFVVPYESIVEARYGGAFEFLFSSVNFSNRRVGSLRRVLIAKRTGWGFRKMILTPSQPDAFLERVRKRANLKME